MIRIASIVLIAVTSVCAELRTLEIARGAAWVSGYWGYSTPKVVFDGTSYYSAGLWGISPETSHGVVYKFDGARWQDGVQLPNIYQPATLLLDAQSRLIVIYNMAEKPAVLMRATVPGAIDDFEILPAPPDMKNGYYLGAAIQENRVYMAYVAMPSYTMRLTSLDLSTNRWSPSIVMAEGQVATKPKTAWTYPILVPTENGLHVVASNSPDGGEGNTYDKVWYLFYPSREDSLLNPSAKLGLNADASLSSDLKDSNMPARHELVAESPLGSTAYAMDMTVDAQGSVHVVHMWNIYKYGEQLSADVAEPGVYDSFRDPATGAWSHVRVAPPCIAGYWNTESTLQVICQEQGNLVARHWNAETKSWSDAQTILEKDHGPGEPTFMDVLTLSSGSRLPSGVALVTSSTVLNGQGSATQILWSVLP